MIKFFIDVFSEFNGLPLFRSLTTRITDREKQSEERAALFVIKKLCKTLGSGLTCNTLVSVRCETRPQDSVRPQDSDPRTLRHFLRLAQIGRSCLARWRCYM